MDAVQRALKVGLMADYYKRPDFAARFREDSPNPWTSDGYFYPDEGQGHASFLLELAAKHLHGYMGTMTHFLRPMAFQVSITAPHARRLLVQPVPDTYHATLLRAPIATWRGIGNDLHQGGALAALAIIASYVNVTAANTRHQDPNKDWAWHSFLAVHQVDVRGPPTSGRKPSQRNTRRDSRPNRTRTNSRSASRGPPETEPPQAGPTSVNYTEIFVHTVCAAPARELESCYASLIPALAPFGRPSYPITLRSWRLELTHTLEAFCSASPAVGLADHLLLPQPLFVLRGLPATVTLQDVLEALATDNQDTTAVQFGYVTRGEGFPATATCWIATGGAPLFAPSGLRALTTAAPSHIPDTPDLSKLRERYIIHRRALGLPTEPVPAPSPHTAMVVPTRTVTSGDPTFAAIARQMPPDVLAGLDAHIEARVGAMVTAQVQLVLRGARAEFAGVRAAQAQQAQHIADLNQNHTQLRQELGDVAQIAVSAHTSLRAQMDQVQSIHELLAVQTRLAAENAEQVKVHDQALATLTSRLQSLPKRNSAVMAPPAPRSPPGDSSPSTAYNG